MKRLLTAAPLLLLACALHGNGPRISTTPVWVRSHNGSPVDVYLLCGDHDATWLGRIPERGADAFEISPAQRRCLEGLNFFLVVQKAFRGYWVGPFAPTSGSSIQLVIEKYAGLSTAQVLRDSH
jgi:hypothetical protein